MEKHKFSYIKMTLCMASAVLFVVMQREIFFALLPFAAAFLFSLPVRKLSSKICKSGAGARGVISFFIMLSALVLCGGLLFAGAKKLFCEISLLAHRINENPELVLDTFDTLRDKLASGKILSHLIKDPKLSELTEGFEGFISSSFSDFISGLFEKLSALAISGAGRAVSCVLFLSVFLMSCFYFVCDDGKIHGFLQEILLLDKSKKISALLANAKSTVLKYLSASLILGVISFLILFVGLSIIGSKYALFSALAIAVVDFLPILGASAVLLPWSAACFCLGDARTGVGLLIVCAVLVIFRQIFEPKIIGKRVGLHPLATLFSVYVGMRLLGGLGLVLGPVIAVGIKGILEAKSLDKESLI